MPEISEPRVAVYLDFDNIVISRYDQVHGRGHFMRDRGRFADAARGADLEVSLKLSLATVDIGAIIDFAASFGTLVLTRAYADWSAPVNADYRQQLVARAIDLVQLFPAAAYAKNGADIRLAVDAVEDMFRLPDLTHVVIVAGDSDYIALAQRCKRLGRYVVGIGVAGSTSKALAAACDEFDIYDSLPGVPVLDRAEVRASTEAMRASIADPHGGAGTDAAAGTDAGSGTDAGAGAGAGTDTATGAGASAGTDADAGPAADAAAAKKGTRKAATKTTAQKAGAKKAAAAEASAQAPDARTATEASLVSALDAVANGAEQAASADAASAPDSAQAPSGGAARTAPADDASAGSASNGNAAGGTTGGSTSKRAPRRASTAMVIAAYEPEHDEHDDEDEEHSEDPQDAATKLLERALELGHGKDDADWLHSSAVKQHMKRMDPSFSEKALGFRSFSDFVKAREDIAELEETGHERLVRLKQQ